jgi:hypothetical protein
MKLNLSRFALLVLATLVLGSAAYSQEVNVKAQIPFGFVLGDQSYPAGEYAVQTMRANNSSLYVTSQAGATPALILTHSHTSNERADKTKLVFHRIGNTCFLYQVWVAGSAIGREFPKSPTETQLAKNGSTSETVIVAASTTHP